ncbi:MAG: preprotein translocase subunit SecG [Clostridia bacterium]|nr:preprotein translocase subunit SecG [Clostridia bacterium]
MTIMVKNILTVVYIIVCVALIILATVQAKDSQGASGAITGSTTNNFYEKNKGRTKEGALKKATIFLGILFAIGSVGLSFLYLM